MAKEIAHIVEQSTRFTLKNDPAQRILILLIACHNIPLIRFE